MAACSAAVIDTASARPLAGAFVAMERGHAEALAPMVAAVMHAAGLGFAQIDRIMVTTGPGTFTGVRIGLSFAKGLGLARGIPVIGIDSLSAIAANETAESPLLVVSDARNDEVYAACFDAARRLVSGPRIVAAAEAADDAPEGALVIGTAAQSARAAAGRDDLLRSPAGDLPVSARFAHLAAAAISPGRPAPLYLRAPDAKPQAAFLQRAALTIDTAGPEAADLLAHLHAEAFGEGWTVQAFQELLAMPGALAMIASWGGEPQAFLLVRRAADEAEIITIGTRPAARRRGMARQMLARWMEQVEGQGIRHLFLEAAQSNTAARKLYAGLGFAETGRRTGYYRRNDGTEDAIVMRRELRP